MYKIILLPLLLTASLLAQTFNVSTTPELRTALKNAAVNGEDDIVILADNTYKTTDDGEGTFIYLSNEVNSLTLQGSSMDNVILSGDYQHQVLNFQSTQSAILILEKLSILNGNTYNSNTTNELHYGGGVQTDYDIEVNDCNFTDNSATYDGGGFNSFGYAYVTNSYFEKNKNAGFKSVGATVINSTFKNNTKISTAYRGAGFYSTRTTTVVNSFFQGNNGYEGGGFFSLGYATVANSTFVDNTATEGGGFSGTGAGTIENCVFLDNSATRGSVFYSYNVTATNLLMSNNHNGIHVSSGELSVIANSIFDNNQSDIDGSSSAIITLHNNYIDDSKILISSFNNNSVYSGMNLGFVDEANGDYHLTPSSDLIDAGITTIDGVTLPTTDLDGNARLAGGNIDIGPYEFSTTRPTINSITYIGIAQEFTELTFSVDYILTSGRTLESISYDYTNNDSWETIDVHTFNEAGTYTVNVKVTDSEGEFSTTSKTIVIAELPFSEMTDEQKLQKAIDPAYYDAIMAIIDTEKTSSYTSGYDSGEYDGIQYVQNNPAEFSLVTSVACALASTEATNTGIATGKEIVIADPGSFGIEVITPLTNTDITNLPAGWSMLAIPSEITDMSIFDSAKIVWFYSANTWFAYSSNVSTASALAEANIGTIATLPANSAVWVEK